MGNLECYKKCQYFNGGDMFEPMTCNHPIWTPDEKGWLRNAIITQKNSKNGNIPEQCPLKNEKPMEKQIDYKNIQELAQKLGDVDSKIETSKILATGYCPCIKFTSGLTYIDLPIWDELRQPLSEFLQKYFEEQRENMLKQLKDEL